MRNSIRMSFFCRGHWNIFRPPSPRNVSHPWIPLEIPHESPSSDPLRNGYGGFSKRLSKAHPRKVLSFGTFGARTFPPRQVIGFLLHPHWGFSLPCSFALRATSELIRLWEQNTNWEGYRLTHQECLAQCTCQTGTSAGSLVPKDATAIAELSRKIACSMSFPN